MTQNAYSFEGKNTRRGRLDYLLHLPRGYGEDGQRQWPLIFFLHGAGERGDDLNLLRVHGIPRVADENPDFPFVAVSPQCPGRSRWPDYMATLKLLLDDTLARYAVDQSRVYLTGMSMGGFATWLFGSNHPECFAAIAPICGYGLPSYGFPDRVCALKDVPVWTFHGALDDVVAVGDTTQLVTRLEACGGSVRFTVYPDLAHDSWTRTYHNPELYAWFLEHERKDAG